jgi:acetyl-CoA acyltransferase
VTYGGQTHPADGNAGIVITTEAKAEEMSRNTSIGVKLISFGLSRVEKAHMPAAPAPAAQRALHAAGLRVDQIQCVKTHNPFIVNDIVLARELGLDAFAVNNFGCSLVWGHPQAPTGLRSVIELIEELADRGGGYGLFTGCAAGDSAMALVAHVSGK